jgi:hypothetical protein
MPSQLRFPLGTESPEIIAFVSQLMARRKLAGRTRLVVDATSFGMPITQEMRRRGLMPVPITFTSGVRAKGNNVPKRYLVSGLLLLIAHHRIKIPPDIKLRAELIEEFDNFTAKYTKKGNPTFSAAAGAHDLIMALSLACYFFENRRGLPRVYATVVGTPGNRISSILDLERFLQDRMLYPLILCIEQRLRPPSSAMQTSEANLVVSRIFRTFDQATAPVSENCCA